MILIRVIVYFIQLKLFVVYQNSRRYHGRKSSSLKDYLLPFLIIIAVGVIVVLLFNLWKSVFGSEPQKAAYLHFVKGDAQMKAWGTEEFFSLGSDTVVMEGDEIVTSSDAEVIMEFFDGTIMRIDGDTNFLLESVDDESSEPLIGVILKDGSLWFNRLYKGTSGTTLTVNMDGVNVDAANASVFELENNNNKVVRTLRVFDDSGLAVDILDQDGAKVVESENVSVGQQIVFTDKVLEKYWAHNSPSVISEIADSFKSEPWYVWNMREDRTPTLFEKQVVNGAEGFKVVPPKEIEGVTDDETGKTDESVVEDVPTKTEPTDAKDQFSAKVPKPTITSVAGLSAPDDKGVYQVTSRVTTLIGTVSNATKFFVNGYELKKFKAGDKTWTYYANFDYGFMKEGANTYEIYAMDAEGNKSETLIIKVFYTKQADAPAAPAPTPPADTTPAPAADTTAPPAVTVDEQAKPPETTPAQ